jgi:hypothetical protein
MSPVTAGKIGYIGISVLLFLVFLGGALSTGWTKEQSAPLEETIRSNLFPFTIGPAYLNTGYGLLSCVPRPPEPEEMPNLRTDPKKETPT